MFLRWRNKIKLKSKLKRDDKVCELHFKSDTIERCELVTVNGTVHEIPRKKFTLKPGAIPTIFPKYPDYYNESERNQKIRKSPPKRDSFNCNVSFQTFFLSMFVCRFYVIYTFYIREKQIIPDELESSVDVMKDINSDHVVNFNEIDPNETDDTQDPDETDDAHKDSILGYIVQFYLVLRMHFAAKEANKTITNYRKAAEMKKMGKLIQGSGNSCNKGKSFGNSRDKGKMRLEKIQSYVETIEEVIANSCKEVDVDISSTLNNEENKNEVLLEKIQSHSVVIEELLVDLDEDSFKM